MVVPGVYCITCLAQTTYYLKNETDCDTMQFLNQWKIRRINIIASLQPAGYKHVKTGLIGKRQNFNLCIQQ